MSLDRPTTEAHLKQLIENHDNLLGSLQARTKQIADLQAQLSTVQNEMEQYRGAISYSQHIQTQVRQTLEQIIAAEMAAKLAADSAAKSAEATL